ncbi:MAG: metal-dependent transcriptional regulator [Candidatus Thermoplasmatota archaeon]|nr:metal-dependent transcriptional regulator [Candidatus Thermoplasmatota archaeon]
MAHEESPKLSTNVEMYLETIYNLTEEGGSAKTTEIASSWDVSPASATEMVQKLSKMGLVDYKPYHGAKLSPDGLRAARQVIRKHRLLERFLHEIVGMEDEERIHDVACEMEHTLSPEVEAWIDGELDHPREGLNGKPIPPPLPRDEGGD